MRLRARLVLLFAAAPIGIMIHAACGGDDDTTNNTAPPATTTAPPPPPPPPPVDATARGYELAGQTCTSPSQCYLDPKAGDAAPPADAGDAGDGGDAGDAGAPSDAGSVPSTGQLPVKGTIHCETKVQNGYCTHECLSDSDCCAVPGECRTAVKQVCSPFTNTSTPMYCFLSCEDADIRAAVAANADAGYWDGRGIDGGADYDPNTYCYYYASVYATCRSSGGGTNNRKICIPKQ